MNKFRDEYRQFARHFEQIRPAIDEATTNRISKIYPTSGLTVYLLRTLCELSPQLTRHCPETEIGEFVAWMGKFNMPTCYVESCTDAEPRILLSLEDALKSYGTRHPKLRVVETDTRFSACRPTVYVCPKILRQQFGIPSPSQKLLQPYSESIPDRQPGQMIKDMENLVELAGV